MNKVFQIILILSFGAGFCQVNIEEIKTHVSQDPQKYYYEYLNTFKTDPKSLSPEQLNYVYYGNNYVDYGYNRLEFAKQLGQITKSAGRHMSPQKRSKLLEEALILYQKNPLNKELLSDLSILYEKLTIRQKVNSILPSVSFYIM